MPRRWPSYLRNPATTCSGRLSITFKERATSVSQNVILLNVHLASQVKRLKLGCAFNITPMWHPLRLAEDFATADVLTNGRIIFGVGRGYHTREVETLGAPILDGDANRELFEEQVEVILKAFNEESFSHKGKYYTLPPEVPYRGYQLKEITMVPHPVRRPVEIWQPIVSGSPTSTLDQATVLLRLPGIDNFSAPSNGAVLAQPTDMK